jgi:AraC-like DNA-binding protein
MVGMFNFLDTINIIAVSQLLFFSIYLIFKIRIIESGKILFWFLITQIFSYGNYFIFKFGVAETLWCYLITVPAGFMITPLYCLYIYTRLFKKRITYRNFLPHTLPSILSLILVTMDISPFHLETNLLKWINEYPVFNTAQYFQILCYNLCAWSQLRKYKSQVDNYYSSGDLAKTNWIEFIICSYIITSVLIGTLEIIFPLQEIINISYVIFWVFLNVIFLKALVYPGNIIIIDNEKSSQSRLDEYIVVTGFPVIEKALRDDKLFLEPEMTLKELSQHLKMPERTVSQIIRQKTGLNFSDFLNSHRIEYARSKLTSDENKKLTILEVLYDSGYNSKSTFNFHFRKITGKSPSQFRADYLYVKKKEEKSPET